MEDKVLLFYLIKGRALPLQFRDGTQVTFSPAGYVPKQFVDGLLKKTMIVGGCCGKPSRQIYIFATQQQLDSGERSYVS